MEKLTRRNAMLASAAGLVTFGAANGRALAAPSRGASPPAEGPGVKICKDCTFKISSRGYDGRDGAVAVNLLDNDGNPVQLKATQAQPSPQTDGIMFIGKDFDEEFWGFVLPGTTADTKVMIPKDSPEFHFECVLDVEFEVRNGDVLAIAEQKLQVTAVDNNPGCAALNPCCVYCEASCIEFCRSPSACLQCELMIISCQDPLC